MPFFIRRHFRDLCRIWIGIFLDFLEELNARKIAVGIFWPLVCTLFRFNILKKPLQRIVTGGMFTATAFFISGFLELELSVSIYFKNTCSNKIYQMLRRCGYLQKKSTYASSFCWWWLKWRILSQPTKIGSGKNKKIFIFPTGLEDHLEDMFWV